MPHAGLALAALCAVAAMSAAADPPDVVNVRTAGAVPDDGKDDTAALRSAITRCRQTPGSVLSFGGGRYDFFPDPAGPEGRQRAMVFRNLKGLTVDGGGAVLIFHGVLGAMQFTNCEKLVVRNLTIDADRPTFSTGKVVAAADRHFDVEVFAEFPVKGGEPIGAFMEYDPQTLWPRRRCLDVYDAVERTELLRPQVLRVHLKRPIRATPGVLMVLRHAVYGPNAINLDGCIGVRVENVTIHTTPGMGVRGGQTTDVSLKHVRVVPRPGTRRIMSATADATHFNACSGSIRIEDCTFQGMGDDATNVHGMFHRVTARLDDRSVTTVVRNKWLIPPRPGHRIEFTDPSTLLPYATGAVESVRLDRAARTHRLVFTEPLPERLAAGHALGNVDWAPRLRIRNCQVIGNRARGFLIQTRDAVIEGNTFCHSQSTGINVTTDFDYWTESIGTRRIVIRNNTFEDLNKGATWHPGVISVFADLKGPTHAAPGVHRDLLIEHNTIRDTDGAAVFVSAADGVVIRANHIADCCKNPGKPQATAAVYIQNSRNVLITANRLAPAPRSPTMKTPLTIGAGCDPATISVRDNQGF